MMYHPLTLLDLAYDIQKTRWQQAARQRLLQTISAASSTSSRKQPLVRVGEDMMGRMWQLLTAILLIGLLLSPAGQTVPVAQADQPLPACYPAAPLAEIRLDNGTGDNFYGDHLIDIDGDSKTDVFHAVPISSTTRLAWRYASAASHPWQNVGNSGASLDALRFGDFNGDGQTDIFSIGSGSLWRYAAPGLHGWRETISDPDQTPLDELRFGDFDGDGLTDIFHAEPVRPDNDKYRWRIAKSAQEMWGYVRGDEADDTNPDRLRLGDFNGNQTTDLFRVVSLNSDWLMQYAEGGQNGWQTLGSAYPPALFSNVDPLPRLRFGHFDGDASLDVFYRGAGAQWYFFSSQTQSWQALSNSGVALESLRFGDFDGDGLTDVFSIASSGRWRVSLGGIEVWRYLFPTVDTTHGRLTCLTGGNDPDRRGWDARMSADGRYAVFTSSIDFYGQGIGENQWEIWLYDSVEQRLTRITDSGADRRSYDPLISANGHRIVFFSNADFNGEGILKNQEEMWLYDLATKNLTRLTATEPGRGYGEPSISADGSRITFYSDADFNNEGIPDGRFENWVYDLPNNRYTRLTNSPVNLGERTLETEIQISSDGRKVVFASDIDFNNEGIPEGQHEIWLYDLDRQSLTRVTNGGPGTNPDEIPESRNPTISADGRYHCFR